MEIIRKIEKKDTKYVFKMMREFYNSPAVITKSPDEILKKDIADCIGDMPFIEGYVFEENNTIIGYSMIAKSYSTEFGGICIWIEDIYIEPEHRRKGISTRFFKYIEKVYGNIAVRYRLEAEEENKSAVLSYKKNGFSVLPYIQMTKEI